MQRLAAHTIVNAARQLATRHVAPPALLAARTRASPIASATLCHTRRALTGLRALRTISAQLRGTSGHPVSGTSSSSALDPPTLTWIDKHAPPSVRPYLKLARIDRPIGTWLLLWPCVWSLSLGEIARGGVFAEPRMLALFGVGAFAMRGAGCIVNDMWDREIDRRVARTRDRPLASGALDMRRATALLGAHLAVGLAVLTQFDSFTIALGASSLGLVATYPLMKRVTLWPQAVLGLTFNWGALLGWAAVHQSLDAAIVAPLYASGVCWTLVYDTIYAFQDVDDDRATGIKSTAIRFGERPRTWLAAMAAASVGFAALAGHAAELSPAFYVGLGGAAAHLAWQIGTVQLHSRADCLAKFRSNRWYGALVTAAIVAGAF